MTAYERVEIQQYSTVYFVGDRARKIHAIEGLPNNGGYDDANSRYLAKKHDHIGYRYEIMAGLGKGAFGDVYKAYDHATGVTVALKIIRNEKRFHRQGKVEVKVLDMLRSQDDDGSNCCVHMVDYFVFRSHLCITFEMHHNDLYTELKAGGFVGFEPDHVRDIGDNTLRCLELLYANSIVHADLKPENMLVESEGHRRVKVIDFGSSCFKHEKVHTYIQSRYYRSPEVMLGLGYDCGIDMWSLGCILVELLTGSPIFPAKNEHELITLQTEVLGIPPSYLLDRASRPNEFFIRTSAGYKPLRYTDRKGRRRSPGGRPLASACGSSDPQFIDFVSRCLAWDPADRMKPQEALRHPYIASKRRPTTKRSYSEDGLVALLTQRTSKSGSNKSLNDSGLDSADVSETGDDAMVDAAIL
jgi:dual specificity tyrosine-phosphorylation-regulated kinase 2/3/4